MNKYAHLLKTNEAVISNFENIKAMTKQELADVAFIRRRVFL